MKRLFSRIIQKVLYIVKPLIKISIPHEIETIDELNDIVKNNKYDNILVLCGPRFSLTNVFNKFIEDLEANTYIIDYVEPNPDVKLIENMLEEALTFKPNLIIGIGGGSTLDAAKALSARITNPNISLNKMKGFLKVKNQPLDMVLIPTTAGSGSECTVAAVISDKENNKKYAINDPKLVPSYMMYLPEALYTMPSHITSTTGMDALTHAVEAYLGNSNTNETTSNAIDAIKLVKDNLLNSYLEPNNFEYRKNMLKASYKAGLAFTNAYVGYVHAIAHAIAAYYDLPHGLLNAVLLPKVLKAYQKSISKKLNIIECELKLDKSFIEYIEELNASMEITNKLDIHIEDNIYPLLLKHINKEVYPMYPVPRYLSKKEIINIIKEVTN